MNVPITTEDGTVLHTAPAADRAGVGQPVGGVYQVQLSSSAVEIPLIPSS